jgi:hypothetical protein
MQRMLALPVNQLGDQGSSLPTDVTEAPADPGPASELLSPVGAEVREGPLHRLDPASALPTPASDIPPAPSLWLDAPIHDPATEIVTETSPEDGQASFPSVLESEIKSRPEISEEEWERSLPVSPEVLEAIAHRPRGEQGGKRFVPAAAAAHAPLPVVAALQPGWLRPLLWTNRAFDAGTIWLGPLGRWLRSPGGRAVLGWAGLGLLAGALGWLLVHELGWTW